LERVTATDEETRCGLKLGELVAINGRNAT
jgi:hypothetical protein